MTPAGTRTGRRTAAELVPAAALVALLALLVDILDTGASRFYSGALDAAHHYALVTWFTQGRGLPEADPSLLEMATYPPGSHLLAAGVGEVTGSPFLGMHLVGIAATVAIWAAIGAILTALPGAGRWWASVAAGAVLLAQEPLGPLHINFHGWELIGHYYYAQLVANAIFWIAVWWTLRGLLRRRDYLRSSLAVAAATVAATVVHLLPAVELLTLLGILSLLELWDRWQAGRRGSGLALPLLVPALTAAGVVLSPGFRASREIADAGGTLELPYLANLTAYGVLAAVVACLGLGALLLGRSAVARDLRTRAVLTVVGAAALAVALPCLGQLLALDRGEGSPYAVKKYGFGLLTVLLIQGAVAIGLLASRHLTRRREGRALALLPVAALVLVACGIIFRHPAVEDVGTVMDLEDRLEQLPDSTVKPVYVVGLGSSPTLSYMLSIGALRAPRDTVNWALYNLRPVPPEAGGTTVVAAGSPNDVRSCQNGPAPAGLVAMSTRCWATSSGRCREVNAFGDHGTVNDARLTGFSGDEPTGRWTDGARATFSCRVADDQVGRPLRIAVTGQPFLPPGVARQRVILTVDGARAEADFRPGRPLEPLEVSLPKAPRELALTLELPDAVSPAQVGLSADARRLALFVEKVTLQ